MNIERVTLGKRRLISLNGSDYFASEEHPFGTTEGWRAVSPDLELRNRALGVKILALGQTMLKKENMETLSSLNLQRAPASTRLFNLMLDGDHTYFVNDFLVHNKPGDEGAH